MLAFFKRAGLRGDAPARFWLCFGADANALGNVAVF